jgi:hypothetical protein
MAKRGASAPPSTHEVVLLSSDRSNPMRAPLADPLPGQDYHQHTSFTHVEVEGGGRCCSFQNSGDPFYAGSDEVFRTFGAHGVAEPASCGVSQLHNNAYALGFNTFSSVTRFIIFPMSIGWAFFCGAFIAVWSTFAEAFGIRPFARLVGQTIGRLVVEGSGKAEYYRKKQEYYERATHSLDQGTRMPLEPQLASNC